MQPTSMLPILYLPIYVCVRVGVSVFYQFNVTIYQQYFSHIVMVPTCRRYGAATPECYIAGTLIYHPIWLQFTFDDG